MYSVCKQTPNQILGIDPVPPDEEDNSGPVLWCGRIWMCVSKREKIKGCTWVMLKEEYHLFWCIITITGSYFSRGVSLIMFISKNQLIICSECNLYDI